MKDVHQSGMGSRDRLEMFDSFKLSLEGFFESEVLPGDDLDCPVSSSDTECHPNLSVGTTSDFPD